MPAPSKAATSDRYQSSPAWLAGPRPGGGAAGGGRRAGPRHREAVGGEAGRGEGRDVLAPAPAVVGGDPRVGAVGDGPGPRRERVPHRRAPTVEVDPALDLGRRGRRSPHEA